MTHRDNLHKMLSDRPDLVPEALKVLEGFANDFTPDQVKFLSDAQVIRLKDRMRYLEKTRIKPRPQAPQSIQVSVCGKLSYDKKGADSVINKVRFEGRGVMRSYKCERCNGWHITHKPLLTFS